MLPKFAVRQQAVPVVPLCSVRGIDAQSVVPKGDAFHLHGRSLSMCVSEARFCLSKRPCDASSLAHGSEDKPGLGHGVSLPVMGMRRGELRLERHILCGEFWS